MIIERRGYRNPRQGPSCLFVLVMLALIAAGGYVIANAEQVRETIMPDPTPEPTRSAPTYAARAALYERDGELQEAVDSYEAAIALDAGNIEYYIPLIRILITLNRTEEALNWAETAAGLEENNDMLLGTWAAAFLAEGDRLSETGQEIEADKAWAEAVRQARNATQLNANNAEAYAIMAAAMVRLGPEQFDTANEAIEIASALEPDSVLVRRHMATVFEYQGYYDLAIEQYEYALNINPNSADLLISLARNFWATNNIPEAILTFEDAIEVDPDNADAFDGLGYMYFLIGEYPRAEENFVRAVELDPEMIRGHAHLGASRYRQFNYDGETGAIPHLERAVQGYGDVSGETAIYFNMLGLAYFYTSGSCQEAEPIFEAVLAVVPEEPNATYGLELCHEAELAGP
jgi:superkiller protein 3